MPIEIYLALYMVRVLQGAWGRYDVSEREQGQPVVGRFLCHDGLLRWCGPHGGGERDNKNSRCQGAVSQATVE